MSQANASYAMLAGKKAPKQLEAFKIGGEQAEQSDPEQGGEQAEQGEALKAKLREADEGQTVLELAHLRG